MKNRNAGSCSFRNVPAFYLYNHRFSDIRGLRKNQDSMTLLVGSGKVHMESCAIISQRLADRINRQLAEIYKV